MTLYYAMIRLELREVFLRDKPQSMLDASPKGTVPVLVMPDGTVLEQSVDIMHWALEQMDPDGWWPEDLASESDSLVDENDFSFKAHLDHYKYWERFPAKKQAYYRGQAEKFLRTLEGRLNLHPYLMGDRLMFADVAIFPFVRQFAFVDKAWFDQAPYPRLRRWLQLFLESTLFLEVMGKYPGWKEGDEPLMFPVDSFELRQNITKDACR
jgi:glutathione S-transferase